MARIVAVETAVPKFRYQQSEIIDAVNSWLSKRPEEQALVNRFIRSSKNAGRNFALTSEHIINLGGLEERSNLFETFGPALGQQVVNAAIEKSGLDKNNFKNLVFTSCSCPSIPSIDALIIEGSSLPRTIKRLPIYQQGCAGGVVGLTTAAQFADLNRQAILTSVELCSLVFQKDSPSVAQFVGASIFADGAAAVVLDDRSDGLQIIDSQSYLIPNTRELMGYDIFDDGFHLRLKKELPGVLAGQAPDLTAQFLARHGLTTEDIKYWLFHPGGIKILDTLEQNFNLKHEQCHWSRDLLETTGNLSSASVLFVLKHFMDERIVVPGEKVIMLGVGPGLTLEVILMQFGE